MRRKAPSPRSGRLSFRCIGVRAAQRALRRPHHQPARRITHRRSPDPCYCSILLLRRWDLVRMTNACIRTSITLLPFCEESEHKLKDHRLNAIEGHHAPLEPSRASPCIPSSILRPGNLSSHVMQLMLYGRQVCTLIPTDTMASLQSAFSVIACTVSKDTRQSALFGGCRSLTAEPADFPPSLQSKLGMYVC